jgi:RecA-family ATPase
MVTPNEASGELDDLYNLGLDGSQAAQPIYRLKTTDIKDVEPQIVKWMWPRRLPFGKFCLLAGDPGLGKSYLTLDIASRVSIGGPWPDGEGNAPQGKVLMVSVEDGTADTIRPRLDLLGANLDNIRIIEPLVESDEDQKALSLADHVALIEQEILSYRASLLILDPLLAFTGAKDTHKASDVRSVLAPLAATADLTGCVILGVMHLNKKSGEFTSIYRITSSGDFAAAARSVQVVGKHPEEDDVRVLAPVKMNLSADPPSIKYGFTQDGFFSWFGTTELEAHDVLQAPSPHQKTAIESAKDFITDLLTDKDDIPSKEVIEASREFDIAEKTLRRAAKDMGVHIFQKWQMGKKGVKAWYWSFLPPEDHM